MLRTNRFRFNWGAAATFGAVYLMSAVSIEARAQDEAGPSPEKGYELAERLCKNCHLIEENAAAVTPIGVPTFRGIANRPGQSGQHITNVLIQPHRPMPDIHLTSEEIENILSYLETLRADKSLPPLLSPKQSPRLKYHAPS